MSETFPERFNETELKRLRVAYEDLAKLVRGTVHAIDQAMHLGLPEGYYESYLITLKNLRQAETKALRAWMRYIQLGVDQSILGGQDLEGQVGDEPVPEE